MILRLVSDSLVTRYEDQILRFLGSVNDDRAKYRLIAL